MYSYIKLSNQFSPNTSFKCAPFKPISVTISRLNIDRSLSFARLHERQQFPRRREVLLALPVQSDPTAAAIFTTPALRAHHQLHGGDPLQVAVAGERHAPAAPGELLRCH